MSSGRCCLCLCLPLALLTAGCPAVADMYTWTDDQGRTHFSDQPPLGHPARKVEPAPTVLVPMHENLAAGKAISETVKSAPAAKPRRQDSGRDRQRQQCAEYRNQLERIQRRMRAGYSGDQGNRLRAKRRELSSRLSWECLL